MRRKFFLFFMVVSAGMFFSKADVELVFSPVEPCAVYDKSNPSKAPISVRTETVYARRLGDALDINPRFEYPEYRMGRSGKLDALKLGNANNRVVGSRPEGLRTDIAIPTDKAVTQVLWFYVYDVPELAASVQLFESGFGWKTGFRVEWHRAHWCKKGLVNAVIGVGEKGSASVGTLSKKDCDVNMWHQLVLTVDGKEMAMYVDGEFIAKTEAGFFRGKNLKLNFAIKSHLASFKMDRYALYERVLTPEEIAEDWKNGQPREGDEKTLINSRPQVEKSTYGYFAVNEKIPVFVRGKKVKEFSFPEPGLYEIEYEGYRFPVGIVPEKLKSFSEVGALNLASRQPEVVATGINRNLFMLFWNIIEPAKQEYDWITVDRVMDECEKKGVKTIFVITGVPRWAKGDTKALEKLKLLLEARYEAMVITQQDCSIIDGFSSNYLQGEESDKKNALKLISAVCDAQLGGKKNIFLRNGPSIFNGSENNAFTGRPSWRGIAMIMYANRCPVGTKMTNAIKKKLLDELRGIMK